jgi:acyl-CoA thioesterase
MAFWSPTFDRADADVFTLKASTQACVGPVGYEFIMGGVAQAAAIEAAEMVTDKPLLWSTIQFVNAGLLNQSIDIEVKALGGGRSISQVLVTLTSDGIVLQTMSAALGGRQGVERQFVSMPAAAAPENCSIKTDLDHNNDQDLIAQFERRIAIEAPDDGLGAMWIRSKNALPISAGLLAITSDFMLGLHPESFRGTSLDNTFRVFSTRPTEWILCVTQMSGFRDGAAMGVTHQFTQDGQLLSVSSQTGLLPRSENRR